MALIARRAGKLVTIQVLLLAITSVVFFVRYGGFQAGSVWGGGVIAMAHTLLLEWRRGCAESGPAMTGGETLRLLYRTALERFVLVALLFALALGGLQLEPAALIAGFIAGQLALIVTGIYKTE